MARKPHVVAPGEGERRAQVGFRGQYRAQAFLVLRALRFDQLQWVSIADPQAKKLDDFQIGTSGRVDAFQMKTSGHTGTVSLNDLTNGEQSLIHTLVEGRLSLQALFPNTRVVAHLVTNDRASTSQRSVAVGKERPVPVHFAAFIEQVWKPLKRGVLRRKALPKAWHPTWKELRKSTGLSEEEFDDFFEDCELDLEFRTDPPLFLDDRERARFDDDIAKLASLFADLAGSAERVVRLTRDELLRRLNWASRYEFRNLHEFPVDQQRYQRLEETSAALERALTGRSRGYVCLLGTPGSGKSTLLTQTLRSREEVVVRYYAYVRDEIGPVNVRGESENFLHDVVQSLEALGFASDTNTARANRPELLNAFHRQLRALERHHRETGRKALILIDGLDHIAREQRPHIALLDDLPSPEQVPEGVLFVLGSQSTAPLPPRIRNHLESDSLRRVETQPLSKPAMLEVLRRAGLGRLPDRQQHEICDIAGGHPLALGYLVELVTAQTSIEAIDEALVAVPRFVGEIEDTYRTFWEAMATDDFELSELVGVIARLRPHVDLTWLTTWADARALKRLRLEFAHYFRREGERWFFFHNSFRRFLTYITAQGAPGEFSLEEDRRIHARIARFCRQAPAESPWQWEQLYHFAEAGEDAEVLATATQQFFREQFFESRPTADIFSDLAVARAAAARFQDPVAVVRLSLTYREIWRRDDDMALASPPPKFARNLLLETGHFEASVAQVRQGMHLRCSEASAIQWCRDFLAAGHQVEAQRIFNLIAPLSIEHDFHGIHPQEDEVEFLGSWAITATHFVPINEVITVIQRFHFTSEDDRQLVISRPPDTLRNEVFVWLAKSLIEADRHDLLLMVEEALVPAEKNFPACVHDLAITKAETLLASGKAVEAEASLNQELQRATEECFRFTEDETLRVAELYAQFGRLDRTETIFGAMERPALTNDSRGEGRAFIPLFRYFRLKHAVGAAGTPVDLALPPRDADDAGRVLMERALSSIAWIWAQAWRRVALDLHTLGQLLPSLLSLYNRDEVERMDWRYGVEIKFSRLQFYEWLIGAFAAHGHPALDLLCRSVTSDWQDRRKRRCWHVPYQREFLTEAFRAGVDRKWVIEWLDAIEKEIPQSDSTDARVSTYAEQAHAWLLVGDRERAEQMRRQLMRSSFGIGYRKDAQLETWIHLVPFVLGSQPQRALETLHWLARCIAGLDNAVESRTCRNAAHKLIVACVDLQPLQAIAFFRWFKDKKLLWPEGALCGFLIAALDAAEPPLDDLFVLICRLLIPTAEHGDSLLLERLVIRIAQHLSREVATVLARPLALALQRANEEAQPRWRLGFIRGILSADLDLGAFGISRDAVLHEDGQSYGGENLSTTEGTFTLDELEFRDLTIGDLRRLRTEQKPNNYFNWHKLIERIVGRFNRNELLEMVEIFRGTGKFPFIVEAIACRLIDLGCMAESRALGQELLHLPRNKEWGHAWESGTLLATFRILLKTDRPTGLTEFYRAFIDQTELDPDDFATMLPLLTDENDFQRVWAEIEVHLHHLLEGMDTGVEPPPKVPESGLPSLTAYEPQFNR